jgi:hypothetical protein
MSTLSGAADALSRLVVLVEPEVVVCASALARLSCAEVRLSCAWSTVSWAAVGSRVARSCPLTTWSPSFT